MVDIFECQEAIYRGQRPRLLLPDTHVAGALIPDIHVGALIVLSDKCGDN